MQVDKRNPEDSLVKPLMHLLKEYERDLDCFDDEQLRILVHLMNCAYYTGKVV